MDQAAPKRRRGPLGILARVALALLLGFGLLEGGLRLRQWWRYGTTRELIALQDDPASGLEVPVPGSERGTIRISAQGFRSPEVPPAPPPGTVRLGFLGASTTFCAQSSSEAATWPHLLVDDLRAAFPAAAFDYVNAGVPGYTTVQSLANLRHRLAPLSPDVVVIYHGTNDLTHDTRALAERLGLIESARGTGLGSTWSLAWNLFYKNTQFQKRNRGEGATGTLDADPSTYSGEFRAHLRELIAAAQEVAPVVAIATFSQRARPGMSPEEKRAACSSSLYYMPHMTPDGLIAAFAELNRVIREEAKAAGVLLIEDEDRIPADAAHFTDSVHFTDLGCEVMAERILAGLRRDPGFAALVESRAGADPR